MVCRVVPIYTRLMWIDRSRPNWKKRRGVVISCAPFPAPPLLHNITCAAQEDKP